MELKRYSCCAARMLTDRMTWLRIECQTGWTGLQKMLVFQEIYFASRIQGLLVALCQKALDTVSLGSSIGRSAIPPAFYRLMALHRNPQGFGFLVSLVTEFVGLESTLGC